MIAHLGQPLPNASIREAVNTRLLQLEVSLFLSQEESFLHFFRLRATLLMELNSSPSSSRAALQASRWYPYLNWYHRRPRRQTLPQHITRHIPAQITKLTSWALYLTAPTMFSARNLARAYLCRVVQIQETQNNISRCRKHSRRSRAALRVPLG